MTSEPASASADQPVTNGKQDFTDYYTRPDPRAYLENFVALDYRAPAYGTAFARRVIDVLGVGQGRLLDLCCSYGQDAALLNYGVDLPELSAHYRAIRADRLDRATLARLDREFLAPRRRGDAVPVVGLDTSGPAVSYAIEAGLLVDGLAADLEADDAVDLSVLHGVTAVLVVGGIGYIGGRTFARVVDAAARPPWVAGLVLRWVDLEPVAESLRERGYRVAVAADYAVVQRRVVGRQEEEAMLAGLQELGRRPSAVEEAGFHAAVPFVAVPDGVPLPMWDVLLPAEPPAPLDMTGWGQVNGGPRRGVTARSSG